VTNLESDMSERIETARLVLRRPRAGDAAAIFAAYASDPEVTRWLGWPRHRAVADTKGFIAFSDSQWAAGPAGPYVIEPRGGGPVVGGTGFMFETPYRAQTGYVLARDAWGQGFATEALRALTDRAPALGIIRLHAVCHVDHAASARVLEKCGFEREGVLRRHSIFPNSGLDGPLDVLSYARTW
jgi:RimJ/RimL family protein N-acetyltransferase